MVKKKIQIAHFKVKKNETKYRFFIQKKGKPAAKKITTTTATTNEQPNKQKTEKTQMQSK